MNVKLVPNPVGIGVHYRMEWAAEALGDEGETILRRVGADPLATMTELALGLTKSLLYARSNA